MVETRGLLTDMCSAFLCHFRQFALEFDRILDGIAPASDERVPHRVTLPVPEDPAKVDEWRRRSLSRATWS